MKYFDEQTQTWKDVQIKVANAIQNEYGESISDGYSQNFINWLNEYSTTEHRVGTWINGKPLYQKVITNTLPETSTGGTTGSKSIAHSIANVETMFIPLSFVDNTYETFVMPYITSAGYRMWCNASTTTVYLYNQQPTMNNVAVKIVLLYTKTTDTVSTRNLQTRSIPENDDEGEIVRGEEE